MKFTDSLPDRVIFRIEVSEKGKYYTFISPSIARMIHESLRRIYFECVKFLTDRIGRYVPKWRGYLRSSISRYLKRPYSIYPPKDVDLEKLKVELHIGSRLPYAGIVNEMPTSWLVHPDDKPMRLRYRKGIKLEDPEARSNFFEILILETRSLVRKLFWNEIKKLYSVLKEVPNLDHVSKVASLFTGENFR